MSKNTGISWTDSTWNPVRGCSRVSEGCRNCYAERVAARFSGPGMPYSGLALDGKWNGVVRMVPEHLNDPLRWRRPRRIFVNSMSDLFHEALKDEAIDEVMARIALGDGRGHWAKHTFQVLTKRVDRMCAYMNDPDTPFRVGAKRCKIVVGFEPQRDGLDWDNPEVWPPKQLWLGVSVEDQKTADRRIPALLDTPAAVRFVSYEPALGPVDFTGWLWGHGDDDHPDCTKDIDCDAGWKTRKENGLPSLDWIIVGGESQTGARLFDVAWARSTIEQCRAADVACFVKQLGARPVSCFESRYAGPINVEVSGANLYMLKDRAGADPSEWPEDLRVQQFPKAVAP